MLTKFLLFELKRILLNKKFLLLLLIIFCLCLFAIIQGNKELSQIYKDKGTFLEYDHKVVSRFLNWDQYNVWGVRIFYEPSKFYIFFKDSGAFKNITSKADTFAIIDLYSSSKGKNLFSASSSYKDFSSILFLLGSFVMLYMGMISLRNKEFININTCYTSLPKYFLYTTISRLFWLLLFMLLLFISCSLIGVLLLRVKLEVLEIYKITIFLIISLISLSVYYLLGVQLSIGLKFSKFLFLGTILFWLFINFGLIEIKNWYVISQAQKITSNEIVNLKKLNNLMDFEKKIENDYQKMMRDPKEWKQKQIKKFLEDFRRNTFQLNLNMENELTKEIRSLVNHFEKIETLFPSTLYFFLSRELSGQGFYGYFDYFNYLMKIRYDFLQFYIDRKLTSPSKKVEYFPKNRENIFKARSHLPKTFMFGIGLLVFYCIVLLISSYLSLKKLIYKND